MAGEWGHEDTASHGEPTPFDTSVAHVARAYDYWLGGRNRLGHCSRSIALMALALSAGVAASMQRRSITTR
jgi:hypothetical protein